MLNTNFRICFDQRTSKIANLILHCRNFPRNPLSENIHDTDFKNFEKKIQYLISWKQKWEFLVNLNDYLILSIFEIWKKNWVPQSIINLAQFNRIFSSLIKMCLAASSIYWVREVSFNIVYSVTVLIDIHGEILFQFRSYRWLGTPLAKSKMYSLNLPWSSRNYWIFHT